MKLISRDIATAPVRSELLCVFAAQGEMPALPARTKLPKFVRDALKGEFREVRSTDAAEGPHARVLVVGVGKASELDAERVRRVAALCVQRAEALGVESATLWFAGAAFERIDARELGHAAAEGAQLGNYRFQEHKTKPKSLKLAAVTLCGPGRAFDVGVERGRIVARANAFARDLQNQPPNFMTPTLLGAAAQKLATPGSRVTCKVLDADALKRLKMGALLGVSRGSSEPPCLIHLTYKPQKRAHKVVALVGKGLTFDSGGISLKPGAKMWDMKYDMSGGAAVLGVFHALAELERAGMAPSIEVHGVVPASENLPDASAVKPSDVLRAMNGTTIEVLNTDAEGRLILCDALSYVRTKIEPDAIVDLATLTGAVVVALGHEYSGLFTNNDALRDELRAAGDAAAEKLWPMPLADFHRDWMKGDVADLKNITLGDPGAGATAGAAFLAHFVGETPWAHLDIAGPAWGGMNRDYVGGAQGSGVGVRLLVRWLEGR